jgi:flavin reductase (DIM6/NTAB) family NADH-FMN oxidoreductase RutF/uncharacterized protein with FMN-binding domain
MKAANFLNLLLATALVLLCAKLYFLSPPGAAPVATVLAAAEAVPAAGTVSIDSTDLAPGVSGFGGPVPVVVELENGVVSRVSPKLPNDETPAFFKKLHEAGLWQAWDGLPAEVATTARVDAVASATYSSEAAIANVRAALAAAVGQPRETVAAAALQSATDRKPQGGPHAPPPGNPFAASASASDFALAALGPDAAAAVAAAVPAPAPAFREFNVHAEFAENPFTWFTGCGLLLCAGDRGKSNAMTIGWGGLGTLWGRNDAVTVYVAQSRHTREFMDRAPRFTVMAFDKEKQSAILDYMGSHSGRDGDKAAALGLHVVFTDAGTPYYEEAQMVLECETMYAAPFDPAGMKDVPAKLYANFPAGVHTMYIGRIVKALKK